MLSPGSQNKNRAAGHAGANSAARPRRTDPGCIHCGLPIPTTRSAGHSSFCCNGCEKVFELIHGEGFERYYEIRRGPVAPPQDLRPDNLAWVDGQVGADPAGSTQTVRRLSVDVQGVHCAACVWLLQELGRRQPGGLDVRINPTLGKAEITWDPRLTELKEYIRQSENFGYRFGPGTKAGVSRSRGLLVRLGICTAAAMNVMVISIAYYFGLTRDEGALYHIFGRISLFFATVALFAGGTVFISAALHGIRRRLMHLDLPIALGVVVAYGGSLWAYFDRGPDAAYFDTVTLFILLMLTGRWLQERVLEKNRLALLANSGARNLFTRRVIEGKLVSIRVTEIEQGDEIWVVPGDMVPVEGILLVDDGRLSLDWITGESDVREAARGDSIPAGAFNAGSAVLRIAANEPFSDSRLNALLDTTAVRPGSSPGAGQGWWSRVSAIYVAAVLLLATAGFLAWIHVDFQKALEITVSILVITCPCALGLAVPLAHEMTHLALKRRGVFLRSGNFLDKALSVRRILFDKTGTLTLGSLELTEESIQRLHSLPAADREVIYNMTIRSNHPVSRSLATAAGKSLATTAGETPPLLTGADLAEERPGDGLEWRHGDRMYRLGRAGFSGSASEVATDPADAAGETVYSVDGEVVAVLQYEETIKPDAREEVARLEKAGYQIYILSGDLRARVIAVADRLGIPASRCWGALMPEEKAERVRDLDHNSALMIGDGLNDALSFDAAWCAATPAVDRPALPARADFYFLGEGIAAVHKALAAARQCRRVIRDNLIFAVGYNTFALGLCFAGLVTPVVAAILMPTTSIAVVTHTVWRLSGDRLSCRY